GARTDQIAAPEFGGAEAGFGPGGNADRAGRATGAAGAGTGAGGWRRRHSCSTVPLILRPRHAPPRGAPIRVPWKAPMRLTPSPPGRRRRGVAAVEFAVTVPLLLLLLVGIWEL